MPAFLGAHHPCLEGKATLEDCRRNSPAGTPLLSGARRIKRSVSAFTLIEVLFALMIFTLMSLMVAAVVPISASTEQYSNSYTQAMSISQHKIDRLQQMVTAQGLSSACTPAALEGTNPVANPPLVDAATLNGDGSVTATFTNTDNLKRYFSGAKSGSDANDPNGLTGQILLTPFNLVSVGKYQYYTAKITIKWREAGKPQTSYSIESILTSAPSS